VKRGKDRWKERNYKNVAFAGVLVILGVHARISSFFFWCVQKWKALKKFLLKKIKWFFDGKSLKNFFLSTRITCLLAAIL